MSDGITDGTYQSKIPEINIKRTTNHKNDYADTAIYQVMATFDNVVMQIFEADNQKRAQDFIDSIISNGYLKTLNPTLNIVYVNHSIIEDGYYTYSHIYENGQTINYTIYNTPLTYNVADVIQGWNGYVVQFSTDVSHWWYTNHAYANSADGTDGFTTVYPNLNLGDNTKTFIGAEGGNNLIVDPATQKTQDGDFYYLTAKAPRDGYDWFRFFLIPDTPAPNMTKVAVKPNTKYTFSVLLKGTGQHTIYAYQNWTAPNTPYTLQINLTSDWKLYTFTVTSSNVIPDKNVQFFIRSNNGTEINLKKPKVEEGSIATLYMSSASEVQPSDYPQFIGIQHTPIGYLHDDPKWYDWQPFTGTLPVNNTHTEFSFSTKLWDTIEKIKAIAPINKRNIRNDNWKYQPNETYPFIGGYES